ncbi:MAG: MaoC family dehydratase N-terminal domain-containing protein [Thermodesulfobacteriota bacterium]|nr:MaoC family dehydratase N-terminal domain-containing protein [Thermodesulfobacteriota bacterium]
MDDRAFKKRQEEYGKGKWLLFNEIEVGMEFPVVKFALTRELIRKYCRAMGDVNPVYTDEEAAKEAGFDGPIAPTTIVCIYAIPSALLSGYDPKIIPPPGNIHYRQEYEFMNSASPGDTISVKSTVVNKEIRKGRNYITIESEYSNQDGKKIAIGRITPTWAK